MKKSENKELRLLSAEALAGKAADLRATVAQMKFDGYKGKEKNVKKMRDTRHELARVLTILTENAKKPN